MYNMLRFFRPLIILFPTLLMVSNISLAQRDAMMQAFYWDVPVDSENKNGFWYDSLSAKIAELKTTGFTELWLPAPSKGNWGIYDMGYGIHDHYDLGTHDQIGSTETRFGSFEELQNLIKLAHDTLNGPRINLLADIILNHIYSTQSKDFESNPVLKNYMLSQSMVDEEQYHPYPLNEVVWKISKSKEKITNIELHCPKVEPNSNWDRIVFIKADSTLEEITTYNPDKPIKLQPNQEIEPGNMYWIQLDPNTVQENMKVNSIASNTYLQLSLRNQLNGEFNWTDQTRVVYLTTNDAFIDVLTTTGIHYVEKDLLPNITWNYNHFHPGFEGDYLNSDLIDDQVTPSLKWFGHDLNHENPEVLDNLTDWGIWLRDSIGYDGYRFDFVVGVKEQFIVDWINDVSKDHTQKATMVAEYFSENKKRIYDWSLLINQTTPNTKTKVFDFPLKFELTRLCNGTPEYDMRNLLTAGMLFDSLYTLPADMLVTFVDNHDTGKESDKWITRDWKIAYAYILFAPAQPCVFYNHFYGDTLITFTHEKEKLALPLDLKPYISKLMDYRSLYFKGEMKHVSDTSKVFKNHYIAFRGNDEEPGAFLSINNSQSILQSEVILGTEYSDLYDKQLVNLINFEEQIEIDVNGNVTFTTQPRSAAIWMPKINVMR